MKLQFIACITITIFLGVSTGDEDITDDTVRCDSSFCETKGTTCSKAWGFDIWSDEQTLEKVAFHHCIKNDGKPGESIFCCEAGSKEGKIVKELGAQPNEYPAMAYLTSTFYDPTTNSQETIESNCGGTVYNENYIITAAHCVVLPFEELESTSKAHKVTVRLASNHVLGHADEAMLYVSTGENIKSHLSYDPLGEASNANDIAIIKLDKPIKSSIMGKYVKAMRIAGQDEEPKAEKEPRALIMGYGLTDLNKTLGVLLAGPLPLSFPGDEDCEDTIGSDYPGEEYKKLQNICVGGKGYGAASSGDSGGPAICMDGNDRPYLCGVASYIKSNCGTQIGGKCDKLTPTAYVNVAYFHDWLLSQTDGERQRDKQIMKKMKRDFRKMPLVKGLDTTKPLRRHIRSRNHRVGRIVF